MPPTTEQLKDLLAKVTPGEWISGDDPEGDYPHKISIHTPDNFYIAVLDNSSQEDSNATLIALAPTLAAEVVRLREALTKIADEEFVRVGYCQTDIDVQPCLSQLEMQRAARQALDATSAK